MFEEALDTLYTALGVEATLAVGTELYELTVIDKTSGVELMLKGSIISTVYPAAVVRVSNLTDEGLTDWNDLFDASITFNNNTWRIVDFKEKPVPTGDGELYLIVEELSGS